MENKQSNSFDSYTLDISSKYDKYIKKEHIKYTSSNNHKNISNIVKYEIEATAMMIALSKNMNHKIKNQSILKVITNTYTINQKIKSNMDALSLNYRIDIKCDVRESHINSIKRNIVAIYELLLIYKNYSLSYGYEIEFKNELVGGIPYRKLFEIDFFLDMRGIKKPYTYYTPPEILGTIKSQYPITYLIDDIYVEINENKIIAFFYNKKEQQGLRQKTQEIRDKENKRNNNKLLNKYSKTISLLYCPDKKDIVKLSFYSLRKYFHAEEIEINILGKNKTFKEIFNGIFYDIFDIETKKNEAILRFNRISYKNIRFNISKFRQEHTDEIYIKYFTNDKDKLKYTFFIEHKEDSTLDITGALTIKTDNKIIAPSNFYITLKSN